MLEFDSPFWSETWGSTNPGPKHLGRFEALEVHSHRGRASDDGRHLILQGTPGIESHPVGCDPLKRLVPSGASAFFAGIWDIGFWIMGFCALSTAILAQTLLNDSGRSGLALRTHGWDSTIPSFLILVAGCHVRALPVAKNPVTPYLPVGGCRLQPHIQSFTQRSFFSVPAHGSA